MKKIGIISIICILIDQITKILVISNFELNSSIQVINNFFSLTYVRNYGAAWSIFSGNRIFLIAIGIIALVLIYKYLKKNKIIKKIEIITYGLLIGGIIGNLIDRIVYGYVIDFLDFLLLKYNFPVFNMADTFIVVAAILMIADVVRGEINGNNRKV